MSRTYWVTMIETIEGVVSSLLVQGVSAHDAARYAKARATKGQPGRWMVKAVTEIPA